MAVVLREDLKMTSVSSHLGGGVTLRDREYGRSMWKDVSSVRNLLSLKDPWDLEGNA